MAFRNLKIEISQNDHKIRLDHFLTKKFPDISRTYLQKQIVKEKILLNGRPTKKGVFIEDGDTLEIIEILENKDKIPAANPNLDLPLIYEDDVIAIIDKPAGIPTHPVQHEETGTVANWWIAKNPNIFVDAITPMRPGIVHRLDTDTSGLLILAKNQSILDSLQNQFRQRTVKKEYLALVMGTPPEKGSIRFAIAHDPKSRRRMKVAKTEKEQLKLKAKQAASEFVLEKNLGDFSLVRVKTLTGRMHQVRVHLQAIGHPLVGDRLYQKPPLPVCPEGVRINRHCLHACFLSFQHPTRDEPLTFTSQVPEDIEEIIGNFTPSIS